MRDAFRHQAMPGIGQHRRAGIAHQRDARALFEQRDQLDGALLFVVFVIAQHAFGDFIVGQQLVRMAGIFAGNQGHLAQHAQRAKRDVFQVTDRRGHQVQAGRQLCSARWCRHEVSCAVECCQCFRVWSTCLMSFSVSRSL